MANPIQPGLLLKPLYASSISITTTVGASTSASVPNGSDGNRAKFLYATVLGTAAGVASFATVRVTKGASSAVATDMILSTNDHVLLDVKGLDTISVFTNQTAGATVNFTPIEGP